MTESDPIIFYCKDCEDIVDVAQLGRKYVYKCKKCHTKNVAFGTEKSIRSFFRLEELKKPSTPEEETKEETETEETKEKQSE